MVSVSPGQTGAVAYVTRQLHTEKSFRNLIKLNRNQIIFTILRLIWNETQVRLVSNHSTLILQMGIGAKIPDGLFELFYISTLHSTGLPPHV